MSASETKTEPAIPAAESAPDVKRELPPCPMCGEPSDPRFWYRDVQFCDGCWPSKSHEPWLRTVDRMLNTLAERDRLQVRAERAEARANGLGGQLMSITETCNTIADERDRLATEVATLEGACDEAMRMRCRDLAAWQPMLRAKDRISGIHSPYDAAVHLYGEPEADRIFPLNAPRPAAPKEPTP